MIIGWAKNLNTTPEYILHGISYENLLLYSKATPCYDDEKDKWDASLDANNPDNFKTATNKEIFV